MKKYLMINEENEYYLTDDLRIVGKFAGGTGHACTVIDLETQTFIGGEAIPEYESTTKRRLKQRKKINTTVKSARRTHGEC